MNTLFHIIEIILLITAITAISDKAKIICANDNELYKCLQSIIHKVNHVIMTNAEFVEKLKALKDEAAKSKGEILTKISALEEAVNNAGNVSPEVEAAFNDLKTEVQGIDDIVPDPE